MTAGAAAEVRAAAGTRTIAQRLRTAAAVALWLAIVVLSLTEFWMIAVTIDRPSEQWGIRGYEAVIALSFGTVAAILAARRPSNPLGWGGLIVNLVAAFGGVAVQYPVIAEGVDPVGAGFARWVSSWLWVLLSGTFLSIFPLLFPDGRLLSPRWRWAVVLGVGAMALQIGQIILSTQPLGPVPASNSPTLYFEILGPAALFGYGALWLAGGVSASSLLLRYRRARAEERQQIKWVVYAVMLGALGAVVGMTPIFLGQVAFIATAIGSAAAFGIAILRYRLYEIDVIINRTIVYGVLSALLAGVYTASITLSQRLFVSVTAERSDAAIVFTTLIVVSLFTPLKTRLQGIVDRRIKPPQSTEAGSAPSPAAAGAEALGMLGELGRLRASGVVTQGEFEVKKAELLARI